MPFIAEAKARSLSLANGVIARLPIKCQTTTPFPIVGALGILMMIWISVGERVSEIGLLHAMDAKLRQMFF
jgi:hypothetical protein